VSDRGSRESSRGKTLAIIDEIREKVRDGDYEFAIPHFFEEMANDDLLFADIEKVVDTGRIRRRFTRDPRGPDTK
jgi:hypothetical protein